MGVAGFSRMEQVDFDPAEAVMSQRLLSAGLSYAEGFCLETSSWP